MSLYDDINARLIYWSILLNVTPTFNNNIYKSLSLYISMKQLKLYLILLSLFLLSGCTSTINQLNIENFNDLFINDTNISLNYTYSSYKINLLLSNITGSNGTSTPYYAGDGLILNASNYFSLNLTYLQIFNESNIILSLGNWSNDKINYNTTLELNNLFQPLENQRLSNYSNVTFNTLEIGLLHSDQTANLDIAENINIEGMVNSPTFKTGYFTNYLLQSEVLGTTWTPVNISVGTANVVTSPYYQNTAENLLVVNASLYNGYLYQNITNSTNTTWVFSVYMKGNNSNKNYSIVGLDIVDLNATPLNNTWLTNSTIYFNVSNLYWERYSIFKYINSSHTRLQVRVIPLNVSNVSVTMAQLENSNISLNNFPTIYGGATTTTAVTTPTLRTLITNPIVTLSTLQITGGLSGVTTLSMGGALSGVTTGAFSGAITDTQATRTTIDGIVLINTNTTTSGVPTQTSPRLRFTTNLWNGTNSTMQNFVIEVTGVNSSLSRLAISTNRSNIVGNLTEVFSISDNGNTNITRNLSIGNPQNYSGITLYNQTGSPYCVKIVGSTLSAISGVC